MSPADNFLWTDDVSLCVMAVVMIPRPEQDPIIAMLHARPADTNEKADAEVKQVLGQLRNQLAGAGLPSPLPPETLAEVGGSQSFPASRYMLDQIVALLQSDFGIAEDQVDRLWFSGRHQIRDVGFAYHPDWRRGVMNVYIEDLPAICARTVPAHYGPCCTNPPEVDPSAPIRSFVRSYTGF